MYPVQDKNGEMISEKSAIQNRYSEYYEELLKKDALPENMTCMPR